MSNKSTFNEACDLFNKQDWTKLANMLTNDVQCFYLNPSTAPTNTKKGFIDHQTNKHQNESFDPKNQWWNDDDSIVSGIGKWTDQGVTVLALFKFKFKNGLISYMWGAPIL